MAHSKYTRFYKAKAIGIDNEAQSESTSRKKLCINEFKGTCCLRENSNTNRGAIKNIQPANWPIEPRLGRVADGVSNRVDRIKCLGNAVVPQQIYPIFQAIHDIEIGITV